MTPEYAIKFIQDHNKAHQKKEPFAVYITEALNMSIEALEKQIPKKPKIILKGTTDWNTISSCPVCGTNQVSGFKYCRECGQRIEGE